jgi:hypothetical protein
VEHGALHALSLQLGFVLNKGLDSESEELNKICALVHVLCQCSERVRGEAMQQIGRDIHELLVRAFEHANTEGKVNKDTIHSILCIWHILASNEEGAISLLQCRGLVGTIIQVLNTGPDSAEIENEAIGIIKHFTYFAQGYRLHLFEYDELIPTLCRLPFSTMQESSAERLSAIFRNFACNSQIRIAMVQKSCIMAAVVQLSKGSNRRMTRNILFTLESLAMEPDSAIPIIMFGDGMLLNVLMTYLGVNQDDTTRRRAARSLRLLARDKAATLMSRVEQLLDQLAFVALHDPSQDIRVEAAEAFSNCAAFIRSPMPSHDAVLASLAQLSSGPVPDAVAKALKEQALVPDNRPKMAESVDLLSALAELALRDHASSMSKEHVVIALFHLSKDEVNREKMTTEPVLMTLVHACQQVSIRGMAIVAILNLASVKSNHKRMVSHTGLLNALVQFTASDLSSPSLRKDVKKLVLDLVPLL